LDVPVPPREGRVHEGACGKLHLALLCAGTGSEN